MIDHLSHKSVFGVSVIPFSRVQVKVVTKSQLYSLTKRIPILSIERNQFQISAMEFSWCQIAFLFHLIVEIPASLNFFFCPSATLSKPQIFAHGLIRQYALLLISSNIIATSFVLRRPDQLSGYIAGALALYHVGPLVRAITKLQKTESQSNSLGGPVVHFVAHSVCIAALSAACWSL